MTDNEIFLPNSNLRLILRQPTFEEIRERDKQERDNYRKALREYAIGCWDNSDVNPNELTWTGEILPLSIMEQCFTKEEALPWLTNEIKLALEDGRSVDDYLVMLAQGSKHPVVVYMDADKKITVGDGWHRIAIAMIRQTTVYAVIGRE